MVAATNLSDETALAYHGGGLAAARRLFPQAPEPWLDLSTGINAAPFPFAPVSAAAYARLPEAESIAELEGAAAERFGLGAGAGIVAAPGTQALIQLLPRLLGAKKVAILGFTYAEHQRVWAASGAEVAVCDRLDELAHADLAVVVNPNNPDGRLCNPRDLRDLARGMSAEGKSLIVDEAFIDLLPRENSLAPLLPLPGVLVLRSFGKTFGLAGLRLGFALGETSLTDSLRAAIGPWAVSGAAVEIGIEGYRDRAWLNETAARLGRDCARLDALLAAAGFEIVGGTPLFRLARHEHAQQIFRRLCGAGVLTRPFATRPGWLRFGLPHGEADFARLAQAFV
ncbi:threonine-phosphate decarboxylase CobD [Rhodoblastus sp. 17X3]|uniref:threonine-phosphate decarboxylase CobD n=1 Tax=Rhodoblastus sp. 17X3 TaxID=3047026 RepID=UPI0024B76F55|nr:threonine-phosphate decarboxylase CobD [Rhodoblastus sp. 17X3]MDI9849112.1 threonine-phosphate decarboxylase CobD [Rhodoblastus sp. 17X3]